MANDGAFPEKMRRIEVLTRELEGRADPPALSCARELVQALLEVHGIALARVLEIVTRAGDPGRAIIGELTRDGLAASLLLLHGLHPEDLATRVRGALDRLRPELRAHRAEVELLAVSNGVVRVRIHGGGCTSTAKHLLLTVEEAIIAAAPDVTTIEFHGLATDGCGPQSARVPLPLTQPGKSEIRSTKSETNSKERKPNLKTTQEGRVS